MARNFVNAYYEDDEDEFFQKEKQGPLRMKKINEVKNHKTQQNIRKQRKQRQKQKEAAIELEYYDE